MGSADGLPTVVFVLAMVGVGDVDLSFKKELAKVRDDEGGLMGFLEEGVKLHCLLFIFPRLIIIFLAFCWVLFVEFFHQIVRVHLISWLPGVMSVWVPFPFQEVLEAPLASPFASGVQHLFDLILFFTFYYVWGWFRKGLSILFCLLIWG
jgi:hypothetical protein